ncbi:MAG TPA: helix-turn-helix transcriptional regulator [Acetomicrobium sp.]|jgi:transcriptional regulator with XRE-family HTH domain|uniref:helix-turn-helix domain-containing protein n=1 Tax=Acetomicrobium mobile TaxID=97477 RepID=UPI0026EBCE5A|nr:helix-turn-helix transcriptional regulator [Acetomicrobium mobile]HOB11103.1 helix-turn-helix transcriptional regulator [Acetomicrobium sp.]
MMQTEIAKVMSFKGITNKSLARFLGVSDVAICEWKRGRVCVPPGRRKQLADALGVEVDDILDGRGLAKLAEEATLK